MQPTFWSAVIGASRNSVTVGTQSTCSAGLVGAHNGYNTARAAKGNA